MKKMIVIVCTIYILAGCVGQANIQANSTPTSETKVQPTIPASEASTPILPPLLPWLQAGGEKIAFVSDGRLYLMNLNGSQREALPVDFELTFSTNLSWSYDGQMITFGARENEKQQIYIYSIESQELVNFTNFQIDGNNPAWSPDGTMIAFSSWDYTQKIFVQEIGSNEPVQLTEAIYLNVMPTWSFDETAREVVNGPRHIHDRLRDITPVWSPEGTKIVYLSGVVSTSEWDIHIMNADGSKKTPLIVKFGVFPLLQSWSPDGRYLAFIANPKADGIEIYLWDFETSRIIPLTNNNCIEHNSSWSPDGEWLVFSAECKQDGVDYGGIFVIKVDGTGWAQIPGTGPGDWGPVWQP